ncbi:hypothetical protein [Halorubellus salinus]|uniref:hypothetical protein n=1 Tax=Halorubellus salinus TaxID=755309 RepID=UPI001D07E77D|nr:hypothetical protein [Halorubellus salinus]
MTSRRERLGWAALFSLAPAAGIAFATAKVGPRTLADPIVVAAFAVTAVVMFGFMFLAASVGSTDVPQERFE